MLPRTATCTIAVALVFATLLIADEVKDADLAPFRDFARRLLPEEAGYDAITIHARFGHNLAATGIHAEFHAAKGADATLIYRVPPFPAPITWNTGRVAFTFDPLQNRFLVVQPSPVTVALVATGSKLNLNTSPFNYPNDTAWSLEGALGELFLPTRNAQLATDPNTQRLRLTRPLTEATILHAEHWRDGPRVALRLRSMEKATERELFETTIWLGKPAADESTTTPLPTLDQIKAAYPIVETSFEGATPGRVLTAGKRSMQSVHVFLGLANPGARRGLEKELSRLIDWAAAEKNAEAYKKWYAQAVAAAVPPAP